jgi:hypothetical protein
LRAVTWRVGRPRPGATLRLWTIQPMCVWDRLRSEGVLHVEPALCNHLNDWPESYDWMRRQTARRTRGYADPSRYPWWAWAKPKPDLRGPLGRCDANGERHVRLELAVEPDRALLSDFYDWHLPLNLGYVATDMAEYDAWEAELEKHGVASAWPLPEPWHSRLFASWERIFDLSPSEGRPRSWVQATFEELRLADVVVVTEFTHRPAARP